jgi:hypothetical protein
MGPKGPKEKKTTGETNGQHVRGNKYTGTNMFFADVRIELKDE